MAPAITTTDVSRAIAVVAAVALASACGASAARTEAPAPQPAPGPTPTPKPAPIAPPQPPPGTIGDAGGTPCAGPAPGPGYECVRDCGPPVRSDTDPEPGWSWLSADHASRRRQYGCPVCLPRTASIATPAGHRSVSALQVGDPIWTVDATGARVEARVIHAGSTPVIGAHELVRVTLQDGRVISASPGHPTVLGEPLGAVRVGDTLSGARVIDTVRVPFDGERTYDVLPSGATGAYLADGVELRSSFR